MPLTLKQARRITDACIAKAQELGVVQAVAIVDQHHAPASDDAAHGVELDLHADAGPHVHQRLAHLFVVDVAVIGPVQREVKTIRLARLGEQLLRARGVVGFRLHARHETEKTFGDELRRGYGEAFHHAFANRHHGQRRTLRVPDAGDGGSRRNRSARPRTARPRPCG